MQDKMLLKISHQTVLQKKIIPRTLCSNDDASKLQHEGTIIWEQEEKEAKILAKKPINNSKEK